jgi:hypothetical protein
MEPASSNTRFAMELTTALIVQTNTKIPASLDLVEVNSSVTMVAVSHQDGFVTLTTIAETVLTNVPKGATQAVNHALEEGSNVAMDNASTKDGSVMETLTAAMGLTSPKKPATTGQDVDPMNLNARMAIVSQIVGFVMETMTVVTCQMRKTVHPPAVVEMTG